MLTWREQKAAPSVAKQMKSMLERTVRPIGHRENTGCRKPCSMVYVMRECWPGNLTSPADCSSLVSKKSDSRCSFRWWIQADRRQRWAMSVKRIKLVSIRANAMCFVNNTSWWDGLSWWCISFLVHGAEQQDMLPSFGGYITCWTANSSVQVYDKMFPHHWQSLHELVSILRFVTYLWRNGKGDKSKILVNKNM